MPSTSCGKACCGAQEQDSDSTPGRRGGDGDAPAPPPCCDGKPSPCCDVSCLDRLALRTCRAEEHSVETEDVSQSSLYGPISKEKPCVYHARKTRDAYAATLEALGCICRALLALGEDSCCLPKERSSVERRRGSKCRPPTSRPCATTERGCCSAVRPRSTCSSGSNKSNAGSGCCSDGSCGKPEQILPTQDSCSAGCCDDNSQTNENRLTTPAPASQELNKTCCKPGTQVCSTGAPTDLEKGLAGREHVVLSISGMTCTGCETKLQRTLSPLASVKTLKTSLVLARAEFDLDLQSGSLAEVLRHLERTTEFKCERVAQHGSNFEVITPGEAAEFLKRQWPRGVTDMAVVGKKSVRVSYDPELVGARDLVERGWDSPLELAPLRPDATLAAGKEHVRHMGYMTLLSIILTIPVLVLAWAPLPDKEIEYKSVSLVLATIVQVVIAGPFYPKALKALVFSRVIEMDLLIVLSTSAAYIFSVVSFGYFVAGNPLSTGSFFETSTLLVTLIMVGRFVAALARQKAVESISVHSLQPSAAILVDETGDTDRDIDTRLLQYGDAFRVVPETKIPTDGTVISGSSEVDESMITGESRPVEKHAGSAVIAGTINGSGTLVARVTRLPGANTIDMIAGMVDEAKLSKPKLQHLADRVASYFVPVVIALTVITFVVWVAVGVAVRHQSGAEATIQAITYAITVLIVSCPCAIGLAVPMVIVIATGVGAEHGVIFKSAESIEIAYKTTHVVLDKTGTLTEGKLSVVAEEYVDEHGATTAALLLGLVENINHPVSTAVAAHLNSKGVPATEVIGVKTLPGKGVEGTTPSGLVLRAGNSRWLNVSSDARVQGLLSQGHTVFCLTINGRLAALFGLQDTLRPSALPTIRALHARGIAVHVLSGDDDGAVRAVTDRLAIPASLVRSRCSPVDKQAYLDGLRNTNTNMNKHNQPPPVILFCGDGTNDAPALAAATIGVAVNHDNATAEIVAQSAADVVLMSAGDGGGGGLAGILVVLDLSRRAVRRIAFNFAWSFVYNLVAVLLGAGAFVSVRIPPQFAGLGELVSVLPVVAAAVLLRWEGGRV